MLVPVVITDADRVYIVEQLHDAQDHCQALGAALGEFQARLDTERREQAERHRRELAAARDGSPFIAALRRREH